MSARTMHPICKCDANEHRHPNGCRRQATTVIALQFVNAITGKTFAQVCDACLYDDDDVIRVIAEGETR